MSIDPPFALECLGIEKSYGPTKVLRGSDLRVAGGEIHAFLGGNGAGKSTLIRIVSGSVAADAGTVRVGGAENFDRSAIAVVFQELALLPHLSVAENIDLPNRRSGLGLVRGRESRERAAGVLAMIDSGLAARALDLPVASLDLHERQLVEIARALASGARLVLLDEPTANLTFGESERLFAILRRLAGQGIAIVLVSHRMNEIRAVADVCTILRDGRTVVDRRSLSAISDVEIIEAMGQKAIEHVESDRPEAAARNSADGMLRLTAGSLEVRALPGSIVGLAGPPPGPMDLINVLIGAHASATWRIEFAGSVSAPRNPATAVRSGVGYVSGDRGSKGILASLPILDNIMAGTRVAKRWTFVTRRESVAASEALRRLSIKAPSLDALPQTLSGGTQQKLLIARWLQEPPRILVLEEPTRGVDVGTKREIYEIIRRLTLSGCVVVWWSTEFAELAGLCRTVIAFDHEGRPASVLTGDAVDEVALAHATGMAA
ncbi:MAG: sugar ABC transporter ATP-binding protein [Xanthobacteraceae bacterium]